MISQMLGENVGEYESVDQEREVKQEAVRQGRPRMEKRGVAGCRDAVIETFRRSNLKAYNRFDFRFWRFGSAIASI